MLGVLCVCVLCVSVCATLLHDFATNKFQGLKKEREKEAEVCAIAVSRVGSVFLANHLEPN